MNFDEYLSELYFKEKMMFGRDKLYKYIQQTRPDLVAQGLSRRYIMRWLRQQEVHQLFHPICNTKLVQSTVPNEPFAIVAVDLIDLGSMEYKSYKWTQGS